MKGPFIVVIILVIATVLVTTTMERGRAPDLGHDETSNMEAVRYTLDVMVQYDKASTTFRRLVELVIDEAPQPDSLTWTHDTTTCMEQLEQIRVELTATVPPKSLPDKEFETAYAMYQAALGYLHHLTRSGYLLLDYAHAEHRGDVIVSASYLAESADELKAANVYQDTLSLLLKSIQLP